MDLKDLEEQKLLNERRKQRKQDAPWSVNSLGLHKITNRDIIIYIIPCVS